MPVYPYSNVKYKTLIKSELVKLIRKIAVAWEKKTGRNQDLSLDRLKEETIPELKKHMKWYTSKDAAKNWEELSGPSESATLYKVDEHEKGNDGNLWAVTQDKNGRKKWVLSMIHEGDNSYVSKSPKQNKFADSSEPVPIYSDSEDSERASSDDDLSESGLFPITSKSPKSKSNKKCQEGMLMNAATGKCRKNCAFHGMVRHRGSTRCSKKLEKCPPGQTRDSNSKKCRKPLKCPKGHRKDSETGECIKRDIKVSSENKTKEPKKHTSKSPKSKSNKKCQEGMLMNAATGKCRKNCAFHGMVRHMGSTRCSKKLEKCPPGQTRDSNSKKCRKPLKCPKGHRKDSETGECIKYTDTKEFKELNNDIDDDTQLSELSSDSGSDSGSVSGSESNLPRTPNNPESDLSESNLSSDISETPSNNENDSLDSKFKALLEEVLDYYKRTQGKIKFELVNSHTNRQNFINAVLHYEKNASGTIQRLPLHIIDALDEAILS
jgi:hypothetical protein